MTSFFDDIVKLWFSENVWNEEYFTLIWAISMQIMPIKIYFSITNTSRRNEHVFHYVNNKKNCSITDSFTCIQILEANELW